MFRMFVGKLFDLVSGEEEWMMQRVLTVKEAHACCPPPPGRGERRDLCGPISMFESRDHKEMSSILVY
jgi:hypothetical protein